jgi:hypothetical protein
MLRESPDRHVIWEHGNPSRHWRRPLRRPHRWIPKALVLRRGRRAGGPSEPIEHHIGEQPVATNRILGQCGCRIAPLRKLLDDPRQLGHRRVCQPVRDGLRPRALDFERSPCRFRETLCGASVAPRSAPPRAYASCNVCANAQPVPSSSRLARALPSYPGQFVRPASMLQALMEIVQVGLRDLDAERMDVGERQGRLLLCHSLALGIFDLSLLIVSISSC